MAINFSLIILKKKISVRVLILGFELHIIKINWIVSIGFFFFFLNENANDQI